jgi:hypothetical protein
VISNGLRCCPSLKGLDQAAKEREITAMHTVTADKYKRVRLPDAKPQQVFAYANAGSLTRTRSCSTWRTALTGKPSAIAR